MSGTFRRAIASVVSLPRRPIQQPVAEVVRARLWPEAQSNSPPLRRDMHAGQTRSVSSTQTLWS